MSIHRRMVFIVALASSMGIVSSARAADAWQPLFNGKSLDGWKAVQGSIDTWQAADGMLSCAGGGGGWLSTTKEYDNFELELEFRVPPGGNSGVFLRAPHEGNPAYTGMEIQVLDDAAKQYADLQPSQYTGSIYDVVAAEPRVTKPAGEWQKMTILCDGRQVQVTLNGTQIINANLDDHEAKFQQHPGLTRDAGHIGLQNHGSQLDYRNIRIRRLK